MKRGRDYSRSFGFSETRLKRIFSILAISGETEYLKYRNPNFEELCQKPEYANAEVEVIDEQLQPELVTPYNGKYYYVPSLFIDGEKLFEAQPGQDYETIKAAVEKTLKAAAE